MEATLFALLTGGDNYDLHRRLLLSLAAHAPPDKVEVRLWLSGAPEKTRRLASKLGFSFIISRGDIPKFTAMRGLFHSNGSGPFGDITTPWLIWFDGTSYVSSPCWWEQTRRFIATHDHESICYIGQPWDIQWYPGQWSFVQDQKWFTAKPPMQIRGRPGTVFAHGGYFWLRTNVMKLLDWPGPNISCNGGDYFLGEAIRQQGLRFHPFNFGVEVSRTPDSILVETPYSFALSLTG